ncbi:phosphatase 2C-like domain-containing protein [Chytriomyces cf. hyalinus JEL632]|nr:phosphatase 2C-like domain-containing protein [Chytriomyces cf. hyalinus JEL632]
MLKLSLSAAATRSAATRTSAAASRSVQVSASRAASTASKPAVTSSSNTGSSGRWFVPVAAAVAAGAAYKYYQQTDTIVPAESATGIAAQVDIDSIIYSQSSITTLASASNASPAGLRLDSCTVGSNNPSEDRIAAISLGPTSQLFIVVDGHVGEQCAQIVVDHIAPYIAQELKSRRAVSTVSNGSWWWPTASSPAASTSSSDRSQLVTESITAAFERLDSDIVNGAFMTPAPKVSKTTLADAEAHKQLLNASIASAVSGACTLVALVDGQDLFVSCAGDSKAILGSRNEDGSFEAIDLSVENRPDHPEERERILREHPGEDPDMLVGVRPNYDASFRVLQYIAISRALGDAFLKWPITTAQSLPEPLVTKKTVPHCATPPYVTATPLTTHRRINTSKDRFMILCTDGLTDELSSKEAVSIVHGFMRVAQAVEKGTNRVWGEDPLSHQKGWVLDRDDNAAACLVRNAFGGKDDAVSRILAVEYPDSRDVRDDVSVQVVFFRGDASNDTVETLVEDERLGASRYPVKRGLDSVNLSLAKQKVAQLPKWIQWLEASKSAN